MRTCDKCETLLFLYFLGHDIIQVNRSVAYGYSVSIAERFVWALARLWIVDRDPQDLMTSLALPKRSGESYGLAYGTLLVVGQKTAHEMGHNIVVTYCVVSISKAGRSKGSVTLIIHLPDQSKSSYGSRTLLVLLQTLLHQGKLSCDTNALCEHDEGTKS